jgi:hypothetical protein
MPEDQPERRQLTHSRPPAGGLRGAAGANARASGDRHCPQHTRYVPVPCPLHGRPMPGNVRKVARIHARHIPGGVPAPRPYLEVIS